MPSTTNPRRVFHLSLGVSGDRVCHKQSGQQDQKQAAGFPPPGSGPSRPARNRTSHNPPANRRRARASGTGRQGSLRGASTS